MSAGVGQDLAAPLEYLAAGRGLPRDSDEVSGVRWRLAHRAVRIGWFEMRSDHTLDGSPELNELCGMRDDQTLRTLVDLLERVPAEERTGLHETLTAPLGAGSYVELDFHVVRSDGEMLTVALRGEWLRRGYGTVLEGVLVERPSDEARRMADLADRYRALTEVSPDVIVVHQGGLIVYANPATLDVLRANDANQVVGRPILDFFAEASRAAFVKRVSTMEETSGVAEFHEEQVVALDGTVVDIEATSIPTQWRGRPAFQAVARVITERKAAERQLRHQAALIDSLSDAVVVYEGNEASDLRIVSWSKGAEALYGWTHAEVQDRGASLFSTDGALLPRIWRQLLASGVSSHEALHRRKDGSVFPAHVSSTLTRDEEGTPTGAITVSTDITRRLAAEAATRQLEERYSAVVAALEEGVVVLGTDGTIQALNAAAERILGSRGASLVGTRLSDGPWQLIDEHGKPLPPERWPPLLSLRTGLPGKNAVIGLVRDGATTWLSINSRQLSADTKREKTIVCSISDITAAKVAQDRLTHAATHDALTDLPNRAGITERLSELAANGVSDLSVLFVDIDHFKDINDSLGHTAGDQLLRSIAERISAGVRKSSDIIGRLAGDEFVVICPHMHGTAGAEELATRLLDVIRQPVTVTDSSGSEHTVMVTASIGVAHLGSDESPEQVLLDADVAMYWAKENGRSRLCVFGEQLRHRARTRMQVREELAEAVQAEKLTVCYQPIVSTRGDVVGYESLARWPNSGRGEITPSDFIPIAEETGLIVPLGANVLRDAATVAAGWQRAGRDHYVSVNLSAKQIADPGLLPLVEDVLATSGLEPGSLWFEITESSVMRDTQATTEILSALKSLGVKLAMDDFGTGYSSLAYLDQFPVDALKIDRSFVAMIREGAVAPTLIAGIVSLGRSLNLSVIAEGVETDYQAQMLIGLGVHALQGYLYGRPEPVPLT